MAKSTRGIDVSLTEVREIVATDFIGLLEWARTQRVPSIERALAPLPSNIMRMMVTDVLEGDTLYDLYNAAMNVAQNYSAERQVALERWARSLLDRHAHTGEELCSKCGHRLS